MVTAPGSDPRLGRGDHPRRGLTQGGTLAPTGRCHPPVPDGSLLSESHRRVVTTGSDTKQRTLFPPPLWSARIRRSMVASGRKLAERRVQFSLALMSTSCGGFADLTPNPVEPTPILRGAEVRVSTDDPRSACRTAGLSRAASRSQGALNGLPFAALDADTSKGVAIRRPAPWMPSAAGCRLPAHEWPAGGLGVNVAC
jgi:hypothetical protein